MKQTGSRFTGHDPGKFRVIHTSYWDTFFVPGKILAYLLEKKPLEKKSGQKPLYRRVVIVECFDSYSSCLQISSYGGRGCSKLNKAEQAKHSAIYADASPPDTALKEPSLRVAIRASRLDLTGSTHTRINYGHEYKLEHTERVREVGKVSGEDLEVLLREYREVHGTITKVTVAAPQPEQAAGELVDFDSYLEHSGKELKPRDAPELRQRGKESSQLAATHSSLSLPLTRQPTTETGDSSTFRHASSNYTSSQDPALFLGTKGKERADDIVPTPSFGDGTQSGSSYDEHQHRFAETDSNLAYGESQGLGDHNSQTICSTETFQVASARQYPTPIHSLSTSDIHRILWLQERKDKPLIQVTAFVDTDVSANFISTTAAQGLRAVVLPYFGDETYSDEGQDTVFGLVALNWGLFSQADVRTDLFIVAANLPDDVVFGRVTIEERFFSTTAETMILNHSKEGRADQEADQKGKWQPGENQKKVEKQRWTQEAITLRAQAKSQWHKFGGENEFSLSSDACVEIEMLQLEDTGPESRTGLAPTKDLLDDGTPLTYPALTIVSSSQLEVEETENVVSAFAADLSRDLQIDGSLEGKGEHVLCRLQTLLNWFSIRLQENQLSTDEHNMAELVRQQRENIADQIRKAYDKCNTPKDNAPSSPTDDGIPLEGKMARGTMDKLSESPPPPESPADQRRYTSPMLPRYEEVRTFLRESSAYTWLLEKARGYASLTDISGTPLQTITETMNGLFGSMRERSPTAPLFDARLEMDWDLPRFLRRQKYDTTMDIAVERAITLTGSAQNAQAMTCSDYMLQTWPSSGHEVVKALQQALRSPSLHFQSRLSDGTEIAISFISPKATVVATGEHSSLTELCEQFAWLGAALGAGPQDTSQKSSLWMVTPDVSAFDAQNFHAERPFIKVQIQFPMRNIPDCSSPAADGTCWHAMFHHPVVVDSFPTIVRQNDEKGLHISTAMMSALAETHYATHYAETIALKGFCTMLIPTECTDRSITWHFLYNDDGSWLPYNGFRDKLHKVVHNDRLDLDMLNAGDMRNFVGWTSRIDRHLGTEEMEYEGIQPAGAPECSAGLAMEKKLTISISKWAGASVAFLRGERDKSIVSRKDTYQSRVNAARRLSVLLYDRATKRGWLVDGASALLHIARTQVTHPPYSENPHFNDSGLNRKSFKHPDPESGPEAASEMLKDLDNQEHIINSEFGGYEQGKMDLYGRPKRYRVYNSFKQLVSDTWDTFDQIYSRQDDAKKSQTQQLRFPSHSIEGYEYMDLVSLRSSLTRRYTSLHRNGHEWINFVRQINAITLFAQHFGEIYTPYDEEKLCVPWRTVPSDQEYLCVPISLLKELNKHAWEDGRIRLDSPEIAKDVLWTPSDETFKQCMGENESCPHEFHGRVQRLTATLNIRNLLGRSPRSSALKEDSFSVLNGAVIFGNTSQLRDTSVRSLDSGYNSSQAASFGVVAADGISDAADGSSTTVRTSVPEVAFTEDEELTPSQSYPEAGDDTPSGRGSPIGDSLEGEEQPTVGPESSECVVSTLHQTVSPELPATSTPQESFASATGGAPSYKPSHLRKALLTRKLREWTKKIRQGDAPR